ncbi:MAG: SURF1 family protein [Anaerolineales bacterium]|nr:SURF1 family protein [Anaerolineales bacterium]
MLKILFSRRWIIPTLVVPLAVAVMLRLGFWQLDRLEQRRAFNAHIAAVSVAPPLDLTADSLDSDLESMEYGAVNVSGEYDHGHEIAIRNQAWGDQPGVHLLTPLKIAGSDQAVLVDRGWIPLEAYQSGDWTAYEVAGSVAIKGMLRLSQTEPALGGRPDPTPQPGEILRAWNFVNLQAIAQQIPYPLLNIYIQQAPDVANLQMPYRSLPEFELTEGPHLGYAVQWFIFATILGVGYPMYVRRENT